MIWDDEFETDSLPDLIERAQAQNDITDEHLPVLPEMVPAPVLAQKIDLEARPRRNQPFFNYNEQIFGLQIQCDQQPDGTIPNHPGHQ